MIQFENVQKTYGKQVHIYLHVLYGLFRALSEKR